MRQPRSGPPVVWIARHANGGGAGEQPQFVRVFDREPTRDGYGEVAVYHSASGSFERPAIEFAGLEPGECRRYVLVPAPPPSALRAAYLRGVQDTLGNKMSVRAAELLAERLWPDPG